MSINLAGGGYNRNPDLAVPLVFKTRSASLALSPPINWCIFIEHTSKLQMAIPTKFVGHFSWKLIANFLWLGLSCFESHSKNFSNITTSTAFKNWKRARVTLPIPSRVMSPESDYRNPLLFVVENIGNDPILNDCKSSVCPIQIPHCVLVPHDTNCTVDLSLTRRVL